MNKVGVKVVDTNASTPTNNQDELAAEQRRKLLRELTYTVVKLPNGATYTTLKPYSAEEHRRG
jgi:hypothetical protein